MLREKRDIDFKIEQQQNIVKDDLLLNASFNVTLTVLLQDVQSSVRSLVETDRSGPCHHRALVVHAFRREKIEFNKTTYSL